DIEDRQPERQQRGRDLGPADDRRDRQRQAQKVGPGIAEDDPGRMPVVDQEAEHRPAQRGRQERYRELRVFTRPEVGVQKQDRAGDERQRSGQAIEPVDQVDRVHHADDPEDRERDRGNYAKANRALHRQVDLIYDDAPFAVEGVRNDDNQRNSDLDQQFRKRRDPPNVVDDHDADQQDRRQYEQ